MKIRNIEVDFDFLDADSMEKLENEAEKVIEKCENEEIKQMSCSNAIREECKIIEDFFDGVFGEGIAEKIFKGKKNLTEHIKIFEEIIKMKNEQQKDLQNVFERYQPNREHKRHNQFKGNRR